MKFAKQLALRAIPAWSVDYIDYKSLKKQIAANRARCNDEVLSEEDMNIMADQFEQMVLTEVDKVNDRYVKQERECAVKLEELDSQCEKDMALGENDAWKQEFTKLLQSLEYIADYVHTNVTGFQKILKKYDKNFGASNLTNRVWPLIKNTPFARAHKNEHLLVRARQVWRQQVPPVPQPVDEQVKDPLKRRDSILGAVIDDTGSRSVLEAHISIVEDLELDTMPHGQITRQWVVLAQNGLGEPIKVPVIVAKGTKSGPVLGITAALHGNELNGIPLIHKLFSELDCTQLHGTVLAVPVANAPGYVRGQRGYTDGSDLNRLMPGKSNGTVAQVYAYHLMERIIVKCNHLLDLHTASRGRMNSLYVRADMNNPRTHAMARLQNPQIIVHNTSPDGSLRGAAMERNIAAITVEIGDPSQLQKRYLKSALLGVTNIMSHLKMIPHEKDMPEFEPVICSRSFWIFARTGGILSVLHDVNTWVRKGEPIATVHSIFGHLECTYYSPEDGIIVGKNVDPVCQSGNRIIHLGVIGGEFAGESNDGHL